MAEVDDDERNPANKKLINIDEKLNNFIIKAIRGYDYHRILYSNNLKEIMDTIHGEFFRIERDIERWLKEDKIPHTTGDDTRKYDEIYWRKGVDIGVQLRWPLARVIRVKGILIGVDKIGHFFSTGYRCFEYAMKMMGDEINWKEGEKFALEYSDATELGALGLQWGVYSNADISANMGGYAFYVRLYNSIRKKAKNILDITKEERKIIESTIKDPTFTFTQYVERNWNEVNNPNLVSRRMRTALDEAGKKYHNDISFYKEKIHPSSK